MEFLLPLVSFAFVTSITPGPNNFMLSASGIAFGLRRTLPHLFGVSAGFALLVAVCGSGVGTLVANLPAAGLALKSFGTLYLLYLSWTMRSALVPRATRTSSRPLSFLEAAAFQFVNPKAWVMALTAVSVFMPDLQPRWLAVLTVTAVFVGIGLPCIWVWAALGAGLKRHLERERWRVAATGVVAGLMVYSVVAMWV